MKIENSYYFYISKYRKQLMGLAALIILYFHVWVYIFDDFSVLSKIEHLGKHLGNFGVDIFLFLSGLGLINSIENNSTKEFYLKRFKRLFLPFIVGGILISIYYKWNFITILKAFTGYSFLFEYVYTLLWYTFAIGILYVLFPLYYQIFIKAKNKLFFSFAIILIIIIISIVFKNNIRIDFYGFIYRIPVFLVGTYIGYKKDNLRFKISRLNNALIIFIGLVGLFFAYLLDYGYVQSFIPDGKLLSYFLMAISVCFLIPQLLEIINITFINKILAFYGLISYELYCLQEPISFFIVDPIRETFPALLINICFLVFISFISYLLYLINNKISKLF